MNQGRACAKPSIPRTARIACGPRVGGVGAIALALGLSPGCMVGPNFRALPAPQGTGLTEQALPVQTEATPVFGGEAQTFDAGANIESRW